MTCIVGLVEGDKVYIASDAESTWGWTKHDCGSKVFGLGDAKCAWTGEAAVAEAIRLRVSPPSVPEKDTDKWLLVTLPDAIRSTLDGLGMMKDGQVRSGGALLVGWRGRLVSMDAYFAAYEARRGYVAHGSGGEVAIGVMFATEGQKPKDRLKKAIEAARLWSVGVGGTAYIEATK